MIIQISLTVTMKATGNVIQPGVPARGDVTTPVRSSAGSVLKSALGEKLRLRAITCSCDPKANHKPQADFHQRVQLSVLPAVARCSWVCVSNVRKEKGGLGHHSWSHSRSHRWGLPCPGCIRGIGGEWLSAWPASSAGCASG